MGSLFLTIDHDESLSLPRANATHAHKRAGIEIAAFDSFRRELEAIGKLPSLVFRCRDCGGSQVLRSRVGCTPPVEFSLFSRFKTGVGLLASCFQILFVAIVHLSDMSEHIWTS